MGVYQCADRTERPGRAQDRQTKFLRLSATPSLREVCFASNALIPPPGGSSWLIIDGRGHHGLTEARQERSSRRAIVRTTSRKRKQRSSDVVNSDQNKRAIPDACRRVRDQPSEGTTGGRHC